MLATHYQAQAHELPATGSIPQEVVSLGGLFYFRYEMAKLKVRLSYGVIPNHVLKDKRLTAKAKGLFAYIQSKPDGWDFSAERIAEEMADGRESVRTGLIELEGIGLLVRNQWQNKATGTFEHGYELFETSSHYPHTDSPTTENPTSDNPTSENPTRNKERDSKKEEVTNINTETHVAIATVPQAFGKEYVNGILEAIEAAHGSVDGKKQEGRQFAHLLAKKLEKGGVPIEKVPDTIRAVIAKAQETGNAFIIGQTTSPKALFQNWAKIGVALKSNHQKSTVLEIPSL
jgi:hypothetical protein